MVEYMIKHFRTYIGLINEIYTHSCYFRDDTGELVIKVNDRESIRYDFDAPRPLIDYLHEYKIFVLKDYGLKDHRIFIGQVGEEHNPVFVVGVVAFKRMSLFYCADTVCNSLLALAVLKKYQFILDFDNTDLGET